MKYFTNKVLSLKLWSALDIQFANMLVTSVFSSISNNNNKQHIKKSALTLASACLSANIRAGHTCLPLRSLSSNELFQGNYPKLADEAIRKTGNLSIDDWQELLLSFSAIGDGLCVSPLVLENRSLYLHRMWKDECTVAQFFNCSHNDLNMFQKEKIISILNQLFPETSTKTDWHKIATAIAMIHSRVLISGGPGTGKTSTVAKIITALLLYNNNSRIQMTAPTGKSATILTNSCNLILKNLKRLNNFYQYKLISKATTLHSLIGSRLYIKKNKHDYLDILDLDYLIIDEASMVSLSILSQLILILPNQIKVIFLGDHNQLCSVEAGSIFRDVCQFANFNYSSQRKQELIELTGCIFPIHNNSQSQVQHNYNNIVDGICVLKQNYRFHQNSGIGQLANAINLGNYNHALSILNSKIYIDLSYIRIIEKKDYITMILHCAKKFYNYLKILQHTKMAVINILKVFNYYRVLCALRNGPFGVIALNRYIEQILSYKGLITLNNSGNYIGRPIIILQNNPSSGLYNGDIGILLPNRQNCLSAYFLLSNNTIKIVQIYQLPAYETCFAMTVHKSQGSEFQYISIVLPNKHLPILTRELLYTAVTRAHQSLILYATDNILINSINLTTKRYSGLYDKIKKYSMI